MSRPLHPIDLNRAKALQAIKNSPLRQCIGPYTDDRLGACFMTTIALALNNVDWKQDHSHHSGLGYYIDFAKDLGYYKTACDIGITGHDVFHLIDLNDSGKDFDTISAEMQRIFNMRPSGSFEPEPQEIFHLTAETPD